MALAFSTAAISQTSDHAAVNVSFTLVQAIGITEIGTLNFGTAYPGYAVPPVNPKTASSIPLFTISGEPSSSVTITLPITVPLTFSSTTVPFTPTVSGSQTYDQATSSTLSIGTVTATLGTAGTGAYAGNYFLWLGGHVNNDNPLPNLPSGTYTGTYTVQVNY